MKKIVFFLTALAFTACKKDKPEDQISAKIPIKFKTERFDQLFYESKPEDLHSIQAQYPFLFPEGNEDTVWTNKLKNPLLRELYAEVQKKYSNITALEHNLEKLFARIQYYFPRYKTPRVITIISEVDTDAKAIYTDNIAFVSLDCYLGKEHEFYSVFDDYQRIEFEENQILPDLVTSFAEGKIAPPDRTLLAQMIFYGKELYLKDILLPEFPDENKIAYTKDQIVWCKENEAQMWSFFIENNLLYDTNRNNEFRFVNPAPFSKFYLEIDNETPGRVGQWLGWQIVRSFMKNNDLPLTDMLTLDARTLFERSRYKPSK